MAVTGVSATPQPFEGNDSSARVRVSWSALSGASTYILIFTQDDTGTQKTVSGVSGTSYTETGLVPQRKYTVTVSATGISGSRSNAVTFYTFGGVVGYGPLQTQSSSGIANRSIFDYVPVVGTTQFIGNGNGGVYNEVVPATDWNGNIDPSTGSRIFAVYRAYFWLKQEFTAGTNYFVNMSTASSLSNLNAGVYERTVSIGQLPSNYDYLQATTGSFTPFVVRGGVSHFVGVRHSLTTNTRGIDFSYATPNAGQDMYYAGTLPLTAYPSRNMYERLYFYGVPNQVTGLQSPTKTQTSVSLSWSAATWNHVGGRPNQYRVEYKLSSSSTWQVTTTTSTSITISNLTAGQTYNFRVAAQNAIRSISGYSNSSGPWSSTLNVTTGAAVVITPTFSPTSNAFPDGQVGTSYGTRTLAISNATTVEFESSTVPPDLNVNLQTSSLTISGTPTVQGNYSIRLKATSSDGTIAYYPSSTGFDTIVINQAPAPANPTWGSGTYDPFYVGIQYLDSVTASNATSYAITSGALPTGLNFNTSNGTISGTPQQPLSPIQLQPISFTVTAYGATGSVPQSKSFTVSFRFPGRMMTGTSTSTPLSVARRFDGSIWVPIQNSKRMTGETSNTPLLGF